MLTAERQLHLHNTRSRNIFPVSMENCVLYIPMWQEDLQGSPFLSYDQYLHSCTVTGALWSYAGGRWFDGGGAADDLINCGSASTIDNIWDGGGSLEFWINPGSDGESNLGTVAEKSAVGTVGWYLRVGSEAAGFIQLDFAEFFSPTAGSWTITAVNIPINTYSHIVITYNSGNVANDPIIYLNGVSQSLTENLTPVGTRTSDAAANFNLGGRGDGSRTFDGYIREVIAYKGRILTADEALMHYQLTKWG